MRRTVIKHKPTTRTFSVNRWKGSLHYHGCIACHCAMTCACETPEADTQPCNDCRQGRVTFIQEGRYPRECCADRELATKDDRETYKLAGPGPWWICTTCCRQFTSPGSNT